MLGYSEGALLRGNDDTQQQRELWFGGSTPTLTIDPIVNLLTPIIGPLVQTAFTGGDFDEVDVAYQATQLVENLVDGVDCTADGTLTVDIGQMTGLDSFLVTSVELIPGTENLDIGWTGGEFSGSWKVEGRFVDDLVAGGVASVVADVCGTEAEAESAGTVIAQDAVMEFVLDIAGSTPRFFSLGKNQLQSVSIDPASVKLTADNVVSTIGDGLGNRRLQLDLGGLLDLSLIFDVIMSLIGGDFLGAITTVVVLLLETLLGPIFGGVAF